MKIGDYVTVEPDLTPGLCSHGGKAWITNAEGLGPSASYEVEYVEGYTGAGGKTEKGIPLCRLTVTPPPFLLMPPRQRKSPNNLQPEPPVEPKKKQSLKDIMFDATRRGCHKGWRARELGFKNGKKGLSAAERKQYKSLVIADLIELKGYLSAHETVPKHDRKNGKGLLVKAKCVDNVMTKTNLATAWGISRPTLDTYLDESRQSFQRELSASQLCVIESLGAAKARMTPKHL